MVGALENFGLPLSFISIHGPPFSKAFLFSFYLFSEKTLSLTVLVSGILYVHD